MPFTRSSSQCSHFFLAGLKKFIFVDLLYLLITQKDFEPSSEVVSQDVIKLDKKVPKALLKDTSSTVPFHRGTKHVIGLSK